MKKLLILILSVVSLSAFSQSGGTITKYIWFKNVPDSTVIISCCSNEGTVYYNQQSEKFRAYSDGEWRDFGSGSSGGGGITNGAASNELMKSDGTNAVASGIFSTASGEITTGTWSGSDIGFSRIAQGTALSVIGVTGNSTADNASISAGTDHQVLRRSGTSLAFGAVNLAQSAAVTGTLPVGNGGTGLTTGCPKVYSFAFTDESTVIIAGTAKITFSMPYAMTVTNIYCALKAGQTSGSLFTIDINEAGTTILSTKITIDNGETDSFTATTPVVISDTALANRAVITVDVDVVGTGSPIGGKCDIIGY